MVDFIICKLFDINWETVKQRVYNNNESTPQDMFRKHFVSTRYRLKWLFGTRSELSQNGIKLQRI